MAKSKLLQIFALASVVVLAGCASGGGTTEGAGDTATTEGAATETTESTATGTTEAGAETVMVTDGETTADGMMPMVSVVYFDFDKANIRSEFRDLLDAHAAYMAAHPDARVILEGHCDERGTREYNLALGERRANAVSAYFKLKGVGPLQIETVSFGEEKPVDLGKNEIAYAKNRRVEIKYQN